MVTFLDQSVRTEARWNDGHRQGLTTYSLCMIIRDRVRSYLLKYQQSSIYCVTLVFIDKVSLYNKIKVTSYP